MKKNIQIGLKPGERIFINGAVLRVDRKVSIELMNDVTFLLENHVMQVEDANTPLKQVYFMIQMMLMDPANSEATKELFFKTVNLLIANLSNQELISGLGRVSGLVTAGKEFEALKSIRALLPHEEKVLSGEHASPPQQHQKISKKREVA
ncbi:MAG: flagellar biosynthesis repressor FlbT [Alphaproteobacteria bacterium]